VDPVLIESLLDEEAPQKAAVMMGHHGGVSEVPPAGLPMSRPSTLRPRQDGRDGERLRDVDLF